MRERAARLIELVPRAVEVAAQDPHVTALPSDLPGRLAERVAQRAAQCLRTVE